MQTVRGKLKKTQQLNDGNWTFTFKGESKIVPCQDVEFAFAAENNWEDFINKEQFEKLDYLDFPGKQQEMFTLTLDKEWFEYYKEEQILDKIEQLRKSGEENLIVFDSGKISDGYHTFNELYEFRKAYNAALFNTWYYWMNGCYCYPADSGQISSDPYNVHKSWRHYDGELCFGGGWFIVCAKLPTGLISNHYKAEDWDLFKIPEVEKALFPFDGHTGQDVIERLLKLF